MQLISIHAERGRIGKTLVAGRIRDLFEEMGLPVHVIRIESRNAGPASRPDVETIFIEDLNDARDRQGGASSAMDPLWTHLDTENAGDIPGAIILDWQAGASELRREIMASTSLSAFATQLGITGVAVTVTTSDAGIMRQATEDLTWDSDGVPEFDRVLILNEVSGRFAFPRNTESHLAYIAMLEACRGALTVTVPLIGAGAWLPFETARISMRDAIVRDARDLAPIIGMRRWSTQACKTHLDAWFMATDEGLRRAFRFPEAAE